MAVVNELVTNFGFSGNLKPLQDFNTSLSTALPRVSALKIAGAAAGIAIATIGVAKKLNPLTQFIALTGESVQALQALEVASVKFGASSGVAFQAFQTLSQKIAEVRISGDATFAKLGISVFKAGGEMKKASDILKDLNKLFNSSNRLYGKWGDDTVKLNLLQQLGFKELLPLLKLSTAEYEKQLGVVEKFALTGEQAKNLKALNDEFARTSIIFSKSFDKMAATIAPFFTRIFKEWGDFLEQPKKFFGSLINLMPDVAGIRQGLREVAGIKGVSLDEFKSKNQPTTLPATATAIVGSAKNAQPTTPPFGSPFLRKSEQKTTNVTATNNNTFNIYGDTTRARSIVDEIKNTVKSNESDIIQRLSKAGGL